MRNVRFATVAMASVLPAVGLTAELPRWELGAGLAALGIPDYRGAAERTDYVFPFPYLQYRGERLRIDREGGSYRVLRAENLRFDLSASAGPPVSSDESPARAGMPDLDPSLELGVQAEFLLAEDDDRRRAWKLVAPLRAAFTVDFTRARQIGWVFSPYLDYSFDWAWNASVSFGPMFASKNYHEYYYAVDPAFATPGRPAFTADGGYSGSRITFTISRRYPKYWLGAFARYDDLRSAEFIDSPLVQQTDSFMIGAGVARVLGTSRETVRRPVFE